MKLTKLFPVIIIASFTACSTPKSYFTVDTRNKVEAKSIAVDRLQFYIDKDVELKRELASADAKVSSGKVIMENGKYVNIILLKAGTLGACTAVHDQSLDIAFENGDDKNISFSVPDQAKSNSIYSLSAEKWMYNYNAAEVGKITYDGQIYFMRFEGTRPKLMIKKTSKDTYEVDKRVMGGRKVG